MCEAADWSPILVRAFPVVHGALGGALSGFVALSIALLTRSRRSDSACYDSCVAVEGFFVAYMVGFLLCWRTSRIVIGCLLALGIVLSDPLSPLALCLIAGFSFGFVREWLRINTAGLGEPAAEGRGP